MVGYYSHRVLPSSEHEAIDIEKESPGPSRFNYLCRSLIVQTVISYKPKGSMYPNSIYLSLKVVSILVLWGQSIYCLGTWILWERVQSKGIVEVVKMHPLQRAANQDKSQEVTKHPSILHDRHLNKIMRSASRLMSRNQQCLEKERWSDSTSVAKTTGMNLRWETGGEDYDDGITRDIYLGHPGPITFCNASNLLVRWLQTSHTSPP